MAYNDTTPLFNCFRDFILAIDINTKKINISIMADFLEDGQGKIYSHPERNFYVRQLRNYDKVQFKDLIGCISKFGGRNERSEILKWVKRVINCGYVKKNNLMRQVLHTTRIAEPTIFIDYFRRTID